MLKGLPDVLERLRGRAPLVTADSLHSGRWLAQYARRVLLSPDAYLFVLSGVAVGLLADFYAKVESDGEPTMLALTGVAFLALAVALTALSIFVSLVNDAYLRVLGSSLKGGMAGYVVPYLVAALVSAIATMFGAVGALVYKAFAAHWAKAVMLGVEVGLVVWATWAVFQLVVEVAIHGLNRYRMAEAVQRQRADIADILQEELENEGRYR